MRPRRGRRRRHFPGETSIRGYGWAHQQERRRWADVINAEGGAECLADRCLMPSRWITPGEPWDLGHYDGQRGWRGPEHRRCNRTDGARKSNATGNPGARGPRPRRRAGLAEVSIDAADL